MTIGVIINGTEFRARQARTKVTKRHVTGSFVIVNTVQPRWNDFRARGETWNLLSVLQPFLLHAMPTNPIQFHLLFMSTDNVCHHMHVHLICFPKTSF